MASYQDVKGLSVVALAEGKKIGQVEDLVVDSAARGVRWLRLGSGVGSLFGGGGSSWVPVSAVHSIGEHAITINSEADVQRAGETAEAEQMAKGGRALLGKKVLSEDGTFLGEARDFTFAPEDFRLLGIRVSSGNTFSPQTSEIDAGSLLTIGEDLIVVRKGAELADMDLGDRTDGDLRATRRERDGDSGLRDETTFRDAPATEMGGERWRDVTPDATWDRRADRERMRADRPDSGMQVPPTYDPNRGQEADYEDMDRDVRRRRDVDAYLDDEDLTGTDRTPPPPEPLR